MKKAMITLMQGVVLIALTLFGIAAIHYVFVVGVDLSSERSLVNQCKAYAEERNVEFIGAVNAFTYENEPNHAVCRVKDLWERFVFVGPENKYLLERNAKSYVELDVYDASDKTQSYTLSLHKGIPVYIHRKIDRKRLQISYYSFDTRELLFTVDSEE